MKYLLSTLTLFLLFACMDDDDQRFELNNTALQVGFSAKFGGEDYTIQSVAYQYPLPNVSLKNTLFQYYISDLTLLPADNSEPVVLTEIDLIRYQSEGDGARVNRSFFVPIGDYRGVRLGLGVKPELNARNPNEFAADFVLNENEFWNDNARYVFAKIEANADLEGDGTFDTGLTYHMGSDDLYRELSFDEDFTVRPGSRLVFTTDVFDAFVSGSTVFDITDGNQQRVHGGNQSVATDLWNRLAASFELSVQ